MPSSYETHPYLQSFTTRLSNDSIQGLAGASAGVASSIVTCPLDVIKVNLQGRGGLQLWTLDSIHVQRAFQDRGLIGTGRLIWRERGLSGMYRGLGPTILTYLPRWSVYFIVYHKSDEALRRTFGEFVAQCVCAHCPRVLILTRSPQNVASCVRLSNICWTLFHHSHKPVVGSQDQNDVSITCLW